MARVYVYDDLDSLAHTVLGFAIPFIALKWLWLALILFWVFVLYEVAEPESPVSTVGDLVEFMLGVLTALIILISLHPV